MIWDHEKIARITNILKETPTGLTITDLAERLKMNRNSLAKYLEILLISGKVEMETFGTAKVFCLSHRVPLAAMLGFSSDMIAVLDRDHRIVQVNDQFLTFFGLVRDAVLGRNIAHLGVQKLAELPLDPLHQAIREPYPEITILRGQGEACLRIKCVPTVFEDGGKGCTLILEDFTLQRQYERRLAASEARYRAVVEVQTELIVRRLPDLTVTFVNEAFCRFFNVRQEEIIGKPYPLQGIPGDLPVITTAMRSLTPASSGALIQIRALDSSGLQHWMEISLSGLYTPQGTLTEYQMVGRDITERKHAEEEIIRHIAALQFLSESAMSFMDVPSPQEIYTSICSRLNQVMPGALINVNSFNPASKSLTIQSVSAQKNQIFEEELGREYRRTVFPVTDEAMAVFFQGKLIPLHHSFHDFTFGRFPRDACARVEHRLRDPTYYTIGLTWSGNVFGNVNIILPRGVPLADVTLIETFMRQASLALRKNLAEQGLFESEEKYRVLAENSLDGIAITDGYGTIVYANRAIERMLKPGESAPLIGKNIVSYLDAGGRHGLQQKISALSKDTPSFAGMHSLAFPGGVERWLECIVTRIEYRNTPMASFALRDITELRMTERELLVKERAMEASINGMAIIDPARRLIYANPSFGSILDFSAEDLIGKDVTILARGNEELLSMYRQISETLARDGRWFGEVRARKKDGSYVYLMVSITHVKDESGGLICTLLSLVDVSDRMHFEEAFKTTFEKLRETIEFIPDPTFVIDCDRRVVAWNSALAGLTGVSREQMLGKTSYAEAFPFFRSIRPILVDLIRLPAYEVSHLYPGVRRFGNNIFIETFVPALRHGRGAHLWGKATPLIDDEGKCIGAIESIRDITEWKRAEEALRKAREECPAGSVQN